MGSFSMVLKRFELGLFRSSKKLKSGRKVMMDMGAQRPNSPFFVQKLMFINYLFVITLRFILCTVLESSPNFPIYVQYDQKIISYYMKNLKCLKKK